VRQEIAERSTINVRDDVRSYGPLIEGPNRTEHRTSRTPNTNRTRTEQPEHSGQGIEMYSCAGEAPTLHGRLHACAEKSGIDLVSPNTQLTQPACCSPNTLCGPAIGFVPSYACYGRRSRVASIDSKRIQPQSILPTWCPHSYWLCGQIADNAGLLPINHMIDNRGEGLYGRSEATVTVENARARRWRSDMQCCLAIPCRPGPKRPPPVCRPHRTVLRSGNRNPCPLSRLLQKKNVAPLQHDRALQNFGGAFSRNLVNNSSA
jgi:hypothetical protein